MHILKPKLLSNARIVLPKHTKQFEAFFKSVGFFSHI
jgi:hypothetical protein